jgi:hypothetical protein
MSSIDNLLVFIFTLKIFELFLYKDKLSTIEEIYCVIICIIVY